MSWKLPLRQLKAIDRILTEGNFDVVENTCQAIAETARELAPSPDNPGPFATGATQTAIYVSTLDGSDYKDRVADAENLNPTAQFMDERKPRFGLPDGMAEGIVASATVYSDYIENGMFDEDGETYRAPEPFLEPAVDKHEKTLQKEQKKLLRRAGFR